MSIDTRIGAAALIMGFVGIALTILWPDKKWIGWTCLCIAGALSIGWLAFELKQRVALRHGGLMASVLFGAIVGSGLAALIWYASPERPQESTVKPEKTPAGSPSASDSATAVAEKTRVRELFAREIDKPIKAMYAIFTLNKSLTAEQLSDAAVVLSVSDTINEQRPSIMFGVHPDTEEWKVVSAAGEELLPMRGMRSKAWSCPRTMKPDTVLTALDNFFVFRFDSLDRLEAGAMMLNTAFDNVGQLDHAAVNLSATASIANELERVSIVVNDFVVFELRRSDLAPWMPPIPKGLRSGISHGEIKSGQLVEKEIKSVPIDPNPTVLGDFKKFEFFRAAIKGSTSILDRSASINLSEAEIRIHRLMGGVMGHRAGTQGSMTILPGEHGWLPKERI